MNKQEIRRNKSNQIIKNLGIACFEDLPCIEDSSDINLKSLDDICKRAIASLITIQVACDINNGNYEEALKYFRPLLNKYGVNDVLNEKEKRIINGTYANQDVIDLDWSYETYWSLVWSLGLVDDIADGGILCDCDKAIAFVQTSNSFEDFKNKCNIRNIEEILDMLDLYYRYHWAVTEKRIKPETNIGNLNPSNVVERRRGLEWLISKEDDWYDISLDT